MDLASLLGLLACAGFVGYGIYLAGEIGNFYDMPSMLITVGGTIGALLMSYPFSRIFTMPKLFWKVLFPRRLNMKGAIDLIIDLASTARREGILALENRAIELHDPFLRKGIFLVVDGTESELVRNILETELAYLEERHKHGQEMFEKGASFAPAFGMIGTLIGLVNMLKHLSEPETLGPSMAVALITTFYGSVLANMFFLPTAAKLKQLSAAEILYKEIVMEGILSIQAGENPRIIEEKLVAFLPPKIRREAVQEKVAEINAQT
jgi:chemotaxis protein MotA